MQKVKEMINYFGTQNVVLLAILVGLLVINFYIAWATGVWFLNPFNPLTWKGTYLKLRVFYGLLGGLCGFITGVLMNNLTNKGEVE